MFWKKKLKPAPEVEFCHYRANDGLNICIDVTQMEEFEALLKRNGYILIEMEYLHQKWLNRIVVLKVYQK